MKKYIIKLNGIVKGLIFLLRPDIFLGFLKHPFLFCSNLLSMTKWFSLQERKTILNDFYLPIRDYSKRFELYKHVIDTAKISNQPINYLEFGVCGGTSFKWWIEANNNTNSKFYGFDTFEGLPEKWGMLYKKGDMAAGIPEIIDTRVEWVKGLFQDTLNNFIKTHDLNSNKIKVIHLDADLFSSTLFVLASLAPYLKKGDILLFDEFNVPNHEFFAFKIFTESFYIKTKLIGAVNNYLQTGFEIIESPL